MINFVIIEDEDEYVKSIRKVIDRIKYKIKEEVKTREFKGYTKELEEIIKNPEERKIYIMDIKLDGPKSGISIASIIRDFDFDSEIIFITNHDKMFETTYRTVYEVFDFIEKYHDLEKRLYKDIKIILDKSVDKKMFEYKSRNIDLQIYYHSIKYIVKDKEERKSIMVTNNSSFSMNLSLKEILNKLDNRFKMVHRSCVVNTEKVEAFDWSNSKIIFTDGEEITYISKKYKKDVTKHD